jgi:putative transposase
VAVPRARLAADGTDGAGEREWRSELLPAYKRLSRRAEAVIARAYLAGVNTRRVRRALAGLFDGNVGKDAVSRAWRKTRSAWEAWQARDLAGDDIVRLVLDGTAVKVRLDRRAAAISLLIALGVRRDGRKVVLAIRNMGGETEAAWRAVLDDLLARGLAKPELVLVDGGKGLEAALASLWDDVPVQRCTVHKERNLLAHAPKHLHEEIKADFNDMMHAGSSGQAQGVPGQGEAPLPTGRRELGGGR